jgi:hypothetical protein
MVSNKFKARYPAKLRRSITFIDRICEKQVAKVSDESALKMAKAGLLKADRRFA